MYLDKNLEKKWLIKSENRILGPYSFDQIIDLLRKKQISIIDEVRDPETRWLYVRENNEFKNIVEEIRKEIDSKQESTKTFQNAGQNTSITNAGTNFEDLGQKTKTDIVIPDDEVTNARDIEMVTETPMPTQTVRPDPVPFKVEKAKIYGVVTDAKVQTEISNYSNRLKIAVAGLAALVVVGYGTFLYIQKKNVRVQEEEMVSQVKRLKSLGLSSKAIEVYEKLPEMTKKNLLPEFLTIYPTLKKEGIISFEDVKSMRGKDSNSPDQNAAIELISFWESAAKQNYGEAQDFILKASKVKGIENSLKLFIKENDAWLSLKRSQAEVAYDNFKTLYQNPDAVKQSGRYLYGMALSYLAIPSSERASRTKDLLSVLAGYTYLSFELRKELLLVQLYLAKESNDDFTFKATLKQFFNTPTQLAAEFMRPELLLPDTFKWKELDSIKSSVLTKLAGDDAILFKMHDLIENGKLNEASEFLKSNVERVSNVQIKKQLELLLFNAQGRNKEARAIGMVKAEIDLTSPLNSLVISLNLVKVDPTGDITDYVDALSGKDYAFYRNWITLEQLKGQGQTRLGDLKKFLSETFLTVDNFVPVVEGKMMVN